MLDRRMLRFLGSADPDATLIGHLGDAVAAGPGPQALRWQPGEPLRLLLAGYLGAGNVGAEMRTGEIVRQVRHLLGPDNVAFDAIAVTPDIKADALPGVRAVALDGYVPDAIRAAVDATHGVIACEGSMFKSSFSDVLSAIMAASLGMAAADGKLAVGYGAEIGAMSAGLADFVRAQAMDALVLPRNRPSQAAAERLGLRAVLGADTAWTMAAAPLPDARARMRALGWNGRDPVLIVCPTNPFWWPVTADPRKASEMRSRGAHADIHYAQLFFHADSAERRAAYRAYIDGLGAAIAALVARRGMFPFHVAMERVDAPACADLARLVPGPTVIGADLAVSETVGLLRAADLLVSSRFHALVGAMPGLRPAIGVATDERIVNLLDPARVVAANDPALGPAIIKAVDALDAAAVEAASRATVAAALRGIGAMGEAFVAEVARMLPAFQLPAIKPGWRAHLPELPAEIENLLP